MSLKVRILSYCHTTVVTASCPCSKSSLSRTKSWFEDLDNYVTLHLRIFIVVVLSQEGFPHKKLSYYYESVFTFEDEWDTDPLQIPG